MHQQQSVFLILVLYNFIVQNILSSLLLLCHNLMISDRVAMLQLEIFYRHIWCMFLLLIDVFFLFVSVLNQLHPISIYIVYISVLLVVYKVEFCALKGDAQNLPLRRVGRGEISP
jgi:hypothetical protein